MQEIEQKAIRDFESLVGKVVLVGIIQGYKEEQSDEIVLEEPVFARILPYDERGMREDVVRWMDDDVLDPVYDIKVLSRHPRTDDLSSTFVYGTSYHRDGKVEPGHFVVPSDGMVSKHAAVDDWKIPEMKLFEVTLPGFDGGTDETDHLVLWVAAPEAYSVQQLIEGTEARFCGEVEGNPPLEDADLWIPCEAYALVERIREATKASENIVGPAI